MSERELLVSGRRYDRGALGLPLALALEAAAGVALITLLVIGESTLALIAAMIGLFLIEAVLKGFSYVVVSDDKVVVVNAWRTHIVRRDAIARLQPRYVYRGLSYGELVLKDGRRVACWGIPSGGLVLTNDSRTLANDLAVETRDHNPTLPAWVAIPALAAVIGFAAWLVAAAVSGGIR